MIFPPINTSSTAGEEAVILIVVDHKHEQTYSHVRKHNVPTQLSPPTEHPESFSSLKHFP